MTHIQTLQRINDHSLLAAFSQALNYGQISQLAAWLRHNITGLKEAVPAYSQVFIEWDDTLTYNDISQALNAALKNIETITQPNATAEDSRPLTVQVCYHPSVAPDLYNVATTLGLSEQDVIRQHLKANYQIQAIGFMPGFAYLGGLPNSLRIPRRASPRTQVPAGSVAIAENQTAVYPLAAPGGWHLIGCSPAPLGDPNALVSAHKQKENNTLSVGKAVKFEQISLEQFNRIAQQREQSKPQNHLPTQSAFTTRNPTSHMTILQTGPLALLQDTGRKQVQHLGVSQCGSLDNHAYQWANRLLGNTPNSPAIEITLGLFKARFNTPTTIAIAGADCHATLNNRPLHNWASHRVNAGDTLAFGGARSGARAYLAVAGGFECATLFDSCAMNPKEHWPQTASQLSAKQNVGYKSNSQPPLKMAPWYKQPNYQQELVLRVYPSYQFDQFGANEIEKLCSENYQIHPHSDRMGYRLEGAKIHWQHGGISSEPIAFGSVQIPPSGQPIVLLNDRQTLGGYPKIGCVKAEDCWQLAQRQAGQSVRFEFIFASAG